MSAIPAIRHPKYVALAVALLTLVLFVRVQHREPSAPAASAGRWGGAGGSGGEGAEVEVGRGRRRPIKGAHGWNEKVLESDGPTDKFRDNLVPWRKYITSGHSFGSSNQILTHIKMITLAARLDRIPIIDSLYGGEHGEGSESRVSEFYDLARLSQHLDLPILEWQDVKRADSAADESLVCWQDFTSMDVARESFAPIKIKLSYWPLPAFTYEIQLATLAALETLALKPLDPAPGGGPMFGELRRQMRLNKWEVPATLPDQQVLCFDQFFWVLDGTFVNGELASESIEAPSTLGRSWQEVGQHLHYTAAFAALRDEFVASVLGKAGQDYIGVHIRQGDFLWYSRVVEKADGPFVEAVEEVRAELHGADWTARAPAWAGKWQKPLPVVFATDSQDKEYIASLEAKGWHYLDHDKFGTVDKHGSWYPSMLDLAVMSNAVGFVGTSMSSFSALAKNRVESWQDGVTRMTGAPPPPDVNSGA